MTAATGIEAELLDLLAIFIIAAGVGVFVAKVGRFPYTIALLLAGLAVSILGLTIDVELSRDLILLVLLPPLLFEGAATTDLEQFRRNLLPIVTLAIPGLIVSILLLGWVGSYAFGFPLLVALLFAAMILPTDPVSVLALFEELGVPDRLAVLVEGESLLNDGVGVVIFTALFSLVVQSQQATTDFSELVSLETLADVGVEIAVASLGGLVVGVAAGYLVYRVMTTLDEHMTEIVLTLILAYGSFLLAEHYLHVSGVIATVAAGLLIGNRGAEYAMSPRTKISVFNTWDTAAFIVNTFIFLLIGAKTPIDQLLTHLPLIAIAAVLVLAVRAVTVYPIVTLVNLRLDRPISTDYRHLMVWGGLHASIPIALVLGLPRGFPFREELRAMVFGVAAFSLVVQGLSMGRLVGALDVVTRTEAEELYQLLTGRLRAVDAALEAVGEFDRRGDLSPTVASEFREEYERERADLEDATDQLLSENPAIRSEEALLGERQVLTREKSAVMDALRTGLIGDLVGRRLLDEVDLKIDQVEAGESTVQADRMGEEAYREFWRTRAVEYGLDCAIDEGQPSDEPM